MQLTLALDAVGGDHAPIQPVRGALDAAREHGLRVLLVGPTATIEAELARQGVSGSVAAAVEVVPADDVIGMDEHPATAVRNKRNSPPVVAARLVKEGRAAGFISAGNTGATMAAALFVLGRVPGIERPALATLFPTRHGRCLLLDVGANADCRPLHLARFAVRGSIYSERVLGVACPRVGLLNIGEEETKGSQVAQEAHRLLRSLDVNFVGNVEGKDVPAGMADVVVADGFVGNVALKMAEGMVMLAFQLIRQEMKGSFRARLGGLLMRPAFRGAMRHLDYEEYGGAPLLGVDGVSIVAHGRSTARAIRSALRVAKQAADVDLVRLIREGVQMAQSASGGES